MRRLSTLVAAGALASLMSGWAGAAGNADAEHFWPQWRGPYANGVSEYADPPFEWSETKNVRWKVEIPGTLGLTRPIACRLFRA